MLGCSEDTLVLRVQNVQGPVQGELCEDEWRCGKGIARHAQCVGRQVILTLSWFFDAAIMLLLGGDCEETGPYRQVDSESDSSFVRHSQPCMSPDDPDRFVTDMFHWRCTSHAALGGTNSCGVVHHNSCGASARGNSLANRDQGVVGGDKSLGHK